MKGIINKGIQEMIEMKFGKEAWQKIKKLSKCDEPFFTSSDNYPDEMSSNLVIAASNICSIPQDIFLVEFGKYWIPNIGAKSYPTVFSLAGKNAKMFLLSMNEVHKRVTNSILNASPPEFEYEELSDNCILMYYHSDRKLCSLLRGLILGVGIHFNEKLTVQEIACMKNGFPQCIMEVTFHGFGKWRR